MGKKVTVYSTPTCPYCIRVKDFLKESNITFSDVNVAADTNAAQEMFHKSGQMSVPVVAVDEEIIIGFDKGKIKKALGI
ncbi:MAG: glutathione S-transferase N-terminal domain-containing protein [Candidatus Omnitrophica bacterium]|nr:glutathione S-transferase N-terminal domain-containing protein [Candidatus Omnitrophota bacterium]